MPRSSVLWVRVGQGSAKSLHLSPGNGSIKTEILPQRTVNPKQLINPPLSELYLFIRSQKDSTKEPMLLDGFTNA